MGQPAYSNGHARFDTEENAAKANTAFQEWIKLAESKGFPTDDCSEDCSDYQNGDYNISPPNIAGEEIEFIVDSMRVDNCIWQCENIREFFRKQPGCVCIEMDVMVCEESVTWYKSADEG
jgi:hypothetical protein